MPRRHALLVLSLLLMGCSDSPAPKPKSLSTATSDAAAKTEPASGADANIETYEDLIVGLNFNGLPEAFAKTRDAWQSDQENAQKAMRFIDIVARIGELHEEQGTVEQSARAFRTAGQLIEDAKAKGIEIKPVSYGIVKFHLACVAASEKDTAKSMTLLSEAVALGFSEFDRIKQSEVLADVRTLPEFAETLSKWEQAQKERALEEGRSIIANGESFPFSFDLTDVAGKPLRLSDFHGKVCIVDVWGTWCPPCVKEIPSFIRLQDELGDQGFQMIGLNQERSAAATAATKVKDFMIAQGINYPCALISEEVLGQIPNLEGYPTTLFIDHEGKVRAKLVGAHPFEDLQGIVLALLEEKNAAEAAK